MRRPRTRNITSLPNDILLGILDYLDYHDLLHLTLLCKRLSSVISSLIHHYTDNPFSKSPICRRLFLAAPPRDYIEHLEAQNIPRYGVSWKRRRNINGIRVHPLLYPELKFSSEFSLWTSVKVAVDVAYNIGPHAFLTTPSTIPFHEAITTLESRKSNNNSSDTTLPGVLYQNATSPAIMELYISSTFNRASNLARVDGTRPIHSYEGYDETRFEERSVTVIDVLKAAYKLVWEMGGGFPLREEKEDGETHKIREYKVCIHLDEDALYKLGELKIKTVHT